MMWLLLAIFTLNSHAADRLTVLICSQNADSELVNDLKKSIEQAMSSIPLDEQSPAVRVMAESLAVEDAVYEHCQQCLRSRQADVGIGFSAVRNDESYQFSLVLKPTITDSVRLWMPVRPAGKRLNFIKTSLSWARAFLKLVLVQELGYGLDQVDIHIEKSGPQDIEKVYNIAYTGHLLFLNKAPFGFSAELDSIYRRAFERAADSTAVAGVLHYNYGLYGAKADSFSLALNHLSRADSLFVLQGDSAFVGLTNVALYYLYDEMNQDSLAQKAVKRARQFAARHLLIQGLPKTEPDSSQAVADTVQNNPFQKAEDVYKRANDLKKQGELQQALSLYREYLKRVKEMANEPAIARAHFNLGTVLYALEKSENALPNFLASEEYYEMLGDSCRLAKVDNNIGAILHENMDYPQAQLRYESALSQSLRCNDQENVMRSHANLGDLFAEQENWANAHKHYNKALEIAKFYKDDKTVALLNYAKGLAHLKEGHLKLGYDEIKLAFDMGRDTLGIDPEKEKRFLQRLQELIDNQELLKQ